MGDYRLATNAGFLSLPHINNITQSDGKWYTYADITGTVSDPSPNFYCTGDPQVFFHGIANQNSQIGYFINNTHGTSGVTLASFYPSICIMAYLTGEEDPGYTVNIVLVNGATPEEVIDNIQNRRNENIMYAAPWEDAVGSILQYVDEWDDSPSDNENDPENLLAKGGEFADTDPFGFGNDEIDLPASILEMDYSGFITPYKIDNGGLFALAGGIFSNDTWATLKNKFNGVGNPIDYIVSAVEIPYSGNADATKNFNLGGVDIVDGNGGNVPLPYFTHRYEKMLFGSLTLKETWGTEKDYSGTNVSIYLPYVGIKDLDTAIIMNSTITLSAIIDIWSGDLLYVLKINNKSMAYKYLASSGLVYRFQGNCGKQIPIGKVDNSNQLMAMTGSMASMGVGLVTGNPMAAFGGAAGLIGAAAIPPKVSMTGGITGAIGRGDTDEPYLIITQSVPVYPKNWRAHFGAPRYQSFTLGDLSGYVKCSDVHADSIEGANDAERAAIEQALKAGVFMS